MCIFINAPYPCGHCYQCLSRIRNDWSIRLQAEWQNSGTAYHAVLTYDNEHLPKSKNGLATVRKSDFVKFMKRLRHKFDEKLKFFAVSEYGGYTQRPHYHVILFNVPFFDDVQRFEDYNISETMRSLVASAWQNGEVRKRSSYVQTGAQLHYILKDIYNWLDPQDLYNVYTKLSKKFSKSRMLQNFRRNTFDPFIRCGKNDDREKNFRLMSKNLGISLLHKLKQENKDSDRFDYYMSWNSSYIQNKFPESYKDEFLKKQREFYATIDFDPKGRIILPSDIANNRDFLDMEISVYDRGSRRTHLETHRFALPKYYRQKLFSRGLRELYNRNQRVNRYLANSDYLERYGEYDSTHSVPMYLEIAKRDWRLHASAHKDLITKKLLKNEYF